MPLHTSHPSSSSSLLALSSTGAGFPLQNCRSRSCRATPHAEALTYSRDGEEQPLRGGSPPSCGLLEHPDTPQAHVAPPCCCPLAGGSGLEPAGAVQTESRLFTGKQFSLVLSHVWLQHTGPQAVPEEGHEGGWETEIFCVLPARLEQADGGDPVNLIPSFIRNRSAGKTKQPWGWMQRELLSLASPAAPN